MHSGRGQSNEFAGHGHTNGRQGREHPRGIGAPEISSVAWVVDQELPYGDWLRYGRRLGLVGRGAAWWIGDWLRYGANRYGQKYTVAARVTGYDHQTLMNMVYVASRFDVSRRRENVSWSHHAELAALDAEQQERWLDEVSAQRLTVRDLRRELVAIKDRTGSVGASGREIHDADRQGPSEQSVTIAANPPIPARSPPNVKKVTVVTCPECGHRFVGDPTTDSPGR
jgi:hypothetical protein